GNDRRQCRSGPLVELAGNASVWFQYGKGSAFRSPETGRNGDTGHSTKAAHLRSRTLSPPAIHSAVSLEEHPDRRRASAEFTDVAGDAMSLYECNRTRSIHRRLRAEHGWMRSRIVLRRADRKLLLQHR